MAPRLTSRELGELGEKLGEEHLLRMGYSILARNWSWPKGELDLVAELDNEIAFIEVKTRRSQTYGAPEESITKAKQKKLTQSAYAFLSSIGREHAQWRIDVIAIDIGRDGEMLRLEHLVSAVEG